MRQKKIQTEAEIRLKRAVFSSFVGASLEWYDFFLYGAVAGLVFGQLYFPNFDPVTATIFSYATFAMGYFGRALGGIVFGHFGDKIGRKKMLVITLYVMGLGTCAIGLVPTFDQIGYWAPILLIVCRLAQGIGLGGEWGGAVLMSIESAPAHKRAFYGSLPQVGLSVGLLMASGVIGALSYFLTNEQFLAWGWRAAFISSIALLFIGSYVRSQVTETEDFAKIKESNKEVKQPLLTAFKEYPQMMIAAIGARCFEGVAFGIFSVYSITFLNMHGMERSKALFVVTIASLIMGIFMPWWGRVADRIGTARTFGLNSALLAISSFFAFYMFRYHADSFFLATVTLGITFGFIYSGMFGIMSALFAESFPPAVRYSGMSFVYQVSGIPAVGFTPMIATALVAFNDNDPWYLCAYVGAVGIISVLSCIWMSRLIARGYNKA